MKQGACVNLEFVDSFEYKQFNGALIINSKY